MNNQIISKDIPCPEYTRQHYCSYAPGLVDLFQDVLALNAGLNTKWVMRLLHNPLPDTATVDQWRAHFLAMKREYDREHAVA